MAAWALVGTACKDNVQNATSSAAERVPVEIRTTTSPEVSWISPSAVHSSPIQHATLPAEQIERIRALQRTFAEVDPNPAEQWIEDFRRDADPEREIRIYEGMAEAYSAFLAGRDLTLAAKRDAYQVVLLRSGAQDADVLAHLKLNVLTMDDARAILKLYKMPPVPLVVAPSTP